MAAAAPAPPESGADSGEHVIPVTFVASPTAAPAAPAARPAPTPAAAHTSPAKDVAAFALVIVAAFLILWGAVRGARALWRRRSRRCPACRRSMPLLAAAAAYAHLDLAERTEQLVGDVRYEVWACAGCGHVEKRSRVRAFTGSAETLAPIGSAGYLRQQQRDGLSIWPTDPPADEPANVSEPG